MSEKEERESGSIRGTVELMWFALIANYVHSRKPLSNHIITIMNLWVIINVLNGIYSKWN